MQVSEKVLARMEQLFQEGGKLGYWEKTPPPFPYPGTVKGQAARRPMKGERP